MNAFLTLAATLLRALSLESRISPLTQEILSAVAAILQIGPAAQPQLYALNDTVQAMVKADRDPTEAEFNELKARSDAAHALLQSGNV
jgi:hypothetical protein